MSTRESKLLKILAERIIDESGTSSSNAMDFAFKMDLYFKRHRIDENTLKEYKIRMSLPRLKEIMEELGLV